MRRIIIAGLGVALLAGCGQREDRLSFDGQIFRSKASVVDKDDRRDFTVQVSPVSASLAGAKEAGRYEGTKYCIAAYGTSDIEWVVGPDSEDSALTIDRDTLLLSGACRP